MLTNPAVGPDVSPEAVQRTLSGLQVVQGGCESVAPVSAAPPGRHTHTAKNPAPFGTGFLLKRKNKKLSLSTELSALFDAWQFPTLTWGDPTLPSALRRFTSEFGMGSGGTTALVPPGKFFVLVLCLLRSYCVGCSRECQSHTYVCSFHRLVCRLVSAQNPSDSESELKIFSQIAKTSSAL